MVLEDVKDTMVEKILHLYFFEPWKEFKTIGKHSRKHLARSNLFFFFGATRGTKKVIKNDGGAK
jgi:hypothetical protein